MWCALALTNFKFGRDAKSDSRVIDSLDVCCYSSLMKESSDSYVCVCVCTGKYEYMNMLALLSKSDWKGAYSFVLFVWASVHVSCCHVVFSVTGCQ